MKTTSIRSLGILSVALLLVATACQEYEVETMINKDGSGSRTVTLMLDPYKEYTDSTVTLADAEKLFRVEDAGEWSMSWAGEERDPESRPVYTRNHRIAGTDAWSSALSEVFIRGTIESGVHDDIELQSRISLEIGRGATGKSYTYRERFTWIDLRPVITLWATDILCETIEKRYAVTDETMLAELRGLYSGVIDLGWKTFIDDEKLQEEGAEIIATLVRNTKRIVEQSGVEIESEELTTLLTEDLKDDDDKIVDRAERELPGVFGAGFTGIKLSVTLPGIIIESNADKTEGNTATWEFGGLDPLKEPKELFVRSEVIE